MERPQFKALLVPKFVQEFAWQGEQSVPLGMQSWNSGGVREAIDCQSSQVRCRERDGDVQMVPVLAPVT